MIEWKFEFKGKKELTDEELDEICFAIKSGCSEGTMVIK